MVAYSSNYCLPCLEGSDSPCVNTGTVCEPSTVWCDLVNQVENFLLPIDSLLSRTATAIPLASITGGVPFFSFFSRSIAFTEVEYDTDGMVNLDLNPNVITPRRSGVYLAFGNLLTDFEAAPVDGVEYELTILSGTDSSRAVYPAVSAATGTAFVSTQKLFPWTLGVSEPFQLAYQGGALPFQKARLSVWWVCDL